MSDMQILTVQGIKEGYWRDVFSQRSASERIDLCVREVFVESVMPMIDVWEKKWRRAIGLHERPLE